MSSVVVKLDDAVGDKPLKRYVFTRPSHKLSRIKLSIEYLDSGEREFIGELSVNDISYLNSILAR